MYVNATESAEKHLREAIELFRDASREPHAKLLDAIDELARLFIRTGRTQVFTLLPKGSLMHVKRVD